jgi:peptide deformylase
MALRNILQEGDPTLTKTSREVTAFDERLHTLLDDMRETLFAANGVGLAAPQVGVLRRVALVLDLGRESEEEEGEEREPFVIELINPLILTEEGAQEEYEGCLSIPGLVGKVTRPQRVKVRAQDRHGAWIEVEGEGFMARALCHELDHLDGKLYTRLAGELISAAQAFGEPQEEARA